ncbi:MAG: homoserine dehydrogenase [Candidatus Pacebacteria bacterium]|nr:homoserine dehydrogenase [Candidatus Paceibacterota bacterium]
MNKIGIGLVGCGTVGSGLIRNLPKANGLIAQRLGIQLEIRGIAVKDPSKTRPDLPLPAVGDWKKVVADPAVQIVVELVGGTSESFAIAEACIQARKPFVTANKALLAERGQELIALAQKSGSPIYFEASVAGGIPVLKALREGLVANQLLGLHGIINGTSNYILTRMAEAGSDFSTALKEAKDLGYAEADDRLDVDGIDAGHKAAILCLLAYGFLPKFSEIPVEGIRQISSQDVSFAHQLGYVIKLLAMIKPVGSEQIEVRVAPTLLPARHPMASVHGAFNAVGLIGNLSGPVQFTGRGAGPDATSSALLADLAEAAKNLCDKAPGPALPKPSSKMTLIEKDASVGRFYARIEVEDRPGVLAQVAGIFGSEKIGISSVLQPEGRGAGSVPLVFLLEPAPLSSLQRAIASICKLPNTRAPATILRVEDLL